MDRESVRPLWSRGLTTARWVLDLRKLDGAAPVLMSLVGTLEMEREAL